jgi:tetratricopeptide (TPR) repeat protein
MSQRHAGTLPARPAKTQAKIIKGRLVVRALRLVCAFVLVSLLGLVPPGPGAHADQPRPIDRASATTAPDGAQLTADDLRELEAMEQAVKRFEAAQKDYRSDVTHIIRQEYEKKRKDLMAGYDGKITAAEKDENQRREDAIALFEKFLEKYPSDKRWTPDVIFRLAELYYERTSEEALAAIETDNGGTPQPADFTKTIDLYKRLVSEFPDYRLIDAGLYLLGFCLDKMGKDLEGRQAFLALVCSNQYQALAAPAPVVPSKGQRGVPVNDPYASCKPIKENSRFLPEAWTRVGEYHFDYNELELAIAAYSRVLGNKESPYYDKALYKLAWAYYRADRYREAIQRFDELVVFADLRKAESGKEGSDLRSESVQYLGISFAEKDWDGDTIDDPMTGLQRIEDYYKGREKEPHVREIYERLGDVYFDETEYQKAIEVYKTALRKWPLSIENPKIQDRIVLAYERARDFDRALEERTRLAKDYLPGSEWDKHNRDNPEARAGARNLVETSLIKSAVSHHKAAQALKKDPTVDPKKVEQEYAAAAEGYKSYIEQFPNSKSAYEYTFSYAETLFYGKRYAEAAVQYEKVRDSNLDNRYLEDAAFNALKSYEYLIEEQKASGQLEYPPLPELGKTASPVQPIPFPDTVKKLQEAYDAFVQKVPTSGRLATIAYKAAEIDFRYLHWDQARPRLESVLEKYCSNEVSLRAGRAILSSYSIENDLDKIVEWTDRLDKLGCGGTSPDRKVAEGERKELKGGARFKICDRYLDAKEYEKAAPCYIEVVNASPSNEGGNNDKALNNAAVAYENVKRYFAATRLYERIVAEYPKSEFVDEALFRTAYNYQRFFEFDKAVVSYKRLAVDPRFKNSEHHTDALYNAASILENDQAYDEAAKLYQDYAKDPSVKPEDQAQAFFHSGEVYLKNKDPKKAIQTFRDYLKRYPNDPAKVVAANYRIAEALELQKDKAGAFAQYKKLVALGSSVEPASEGAEYVAKAAFLLAESDLAEFEKLKISANTKELLSSKKRFEAEVKKQTETYKRATWLLAAYFRIGYVWELYSKNLSSLLQAPCPAEVQRRYGQEGCDVYQQGVQQQIEPLVASVDEEVVKRYRTTLEQAARLGVSNQWTKLARQKANAYNPDEFPLNKDEHVDYQLEGP